MTTTRFTDLVGCRVPVQQAPIGSCSKPALAVAVANAGGLGMVISRNEPPEVLARRLAAIRSKTAGAIGVNFIGPLTADPGLFRERVQLAAGHVRVIDFFFSRPDADLVDTVHRMGALACWQVGSVEEAVAAEDAGCDLIVAQGIEAGGHVRGKVGLLALMANVLNEVEVPVLAAGGIGTGRALAAVLAAGASGARLGTRFVAAEEAEAHPAYVKALIEARPEDTVYTDAFSVTWPAPHRVLRSCLEAANALDSEIIGEQPGENGGREPVRRYQRIVPTRDVTGAIGAMSLFAGESVGGVKQLQPAAEIVRELISEADHLLAP